MYVSPQVHETVTLATRVAAADIPILITGPNGSGKEKFAEIIQANSRRKDKPFVRVNAGGLPDELLEAELFGAEAGAYTGSTRLRVGRFETAHGGTLFLDEIGNLSPAGQGKLLRVLQTGEYERLGSSQTRKADFRLISATNADLRRMMREGSFREDLFFRLNVIELKVPPLVERLDDVLPLAERFLESGGPPGGAVLSESARQALLSYDWPGNVRELQNVIQRASVVCRNGRVEAADLGLEPGPRPRAVETETDSERRLIEGALERAQGVVSRAAAELGLSRQALYRRMERFGIPADRAARR